jgi:hypothetical protein
MSALGQKQTFCAAAETGVIRWLEGIARERQHQARHDRIADHRWELVLSSCRHQPGQQIFYLQTNYKVQHGGTRL